MTIQESINEMVKSYAVGCLGVRDPVIEARTVEDTPQENGWSRVFYVGTGTDEAGHATRWWAEAVDR